MRRFALLLLSLLPLAATAADIKVLTAGAFKQVLVAVQPDFERRTGHKLLVDNDTAGALQRRIAGGETFDVVVSSPASLQPLRQDGRIADAAPRPLARVAIGVAVKAGAPQPRIGTVDEFRQALQDAKSIAMIDPAAGGSSGVYLMQLFERWGIAPQVRAKAVLVQGGLVAERLVDGKADLAIHQISEILAVPGATLVGPLPAEIQNYTVYAGAAAVHPRDAGAARDLLEALAAQGIEPVLRAKGMEPAR